MAEAGGTSLLAVFTALGSSRPSQYSCSSSLVTIQNERLKEKVGFGKESPFLLRGCQRLCCCDSVLDETLGDGGQAEILCKNCAYSQCILINFYFL